MFNKAVYEYKKRREKRLAARGYRTKLNEYRKTANGAKVEEEGKDVAAAESADAGVRMDAPDKNQQNEPDGGGSGGGGGHGNTRLPFGLCKRFGIEIEKGWGPSDAWAALAGKGITPAGAYTRLKQGKDPAKPIRGSEPQKPKEPKKTFTSHGKEYSDLKGKYFSWSSDPYALEATGEDGKFYRRFATKSDLFKYLKDKGVEEFSDPETGEVVNPKEMELPKTLFGVGSYPQKYYTSATIGLRKGRYSVIGTGLEGKKETLKDFGSLAEAKKYISDMGVSEGDVKISPSVKKREKERVAWLDSDKKEYVESDGVKYGDLELERTGYGRYAITGSSEDGRRFSYDCGYSRSKALRYLQEQGVERIKEGDGFINPLEIKVPKTIATVDGTEYAELGMERSEAYGLVFYGKDTDGDKSCIGWLKAGETYNEFAKRMAERCGIGEDQFTISDDVKKEIEQKKKDDAEREKRKAEFEAKAISIGGDHYADVELVRNPYDSSEYHLIGYDRHGNRRDITSNDDLYSAEKVLIRYGIDPDTVIKDPEVRKAFDKYLAYKKDYEANSIKYGGHRYKDVEVVQDGDEYRVIGRDIRGRTREMFRATEFEKLKKEFETTGKSLDDISMDRGCKKMAEKEQAVKEALATGEYYKAEGRKEAYKDLYVEKTPYGYSIKGTDTEGIKSDYKSDLTYDDAIEKMEKLGVRDYKIHDGDKVYDRPFEGMRKVVLMRTPDGFKVMATTGAGEVKEVHRSTDEAEARNWIRDNGVDSSRVKTRGMNPNDDVPRTHTQKSLGSFDEYRMRKIEGTFVDDMTDGDKAAAAEMLTEIFTQGAYRVARSTDSFGGIIENGYKSQVETGQGGYGAAHSVSLRQDASKIFFGHKGLDKSEYEKCGYIGLADDVEDWDDSNHPCYGGSSPLAYTLKKDRVKDRTTYTYGDSLNTRYSMSSAGYAGDKPTIEGLTSLRSESYVQDALKAFKQYKEGKISYQEMFKKIRSHANNGYIELQFHGPVTVEDIEKVTFNHEKDLKKAFSKMSDSRRKKVIGLLQSNNVKVEYRDGRGTAFQDAWEWIRTNYPADFEP